jgi:hypothetical protein
MSSSHTSGRGGGAAIDSANYLVGTAQGDLSAEIVAGATPLGELGGTWPLPTVDALHSGTRHQVHVVAAVAEIDNNDTTLSNDLELLLALAANEVWAFDSIVIYDSSTVADYKIAWTVPAGATIRYQIDGLSAALAAFITSVSASATAVACGGAAVGTALTVRCMGIVANGANAGNLQFQHAQNTGEVSDSTRQTNSFLRAWRIS